MKDILNIWLENERDLKLKLFDYLKCNINSEEVVSTALGLIKNVDATIEMIIAFKNDIK